MSSFYVLNLNLVNWVIQRRNQQYITKDTFWKHLFYILIYNRKFVLSYWQLDKEKVFMVIGDVVAVDQFGYELEWLFFSEFRCLHQAFIEL